MRQRLAVGVLLPQGAADKPTQAPALRADPDNGPVLIRDARPDDWSAIWPFWRVIVAAGETYAYDQDLSSAEAERLWMVGPPGRTTVAAGDDRAVLGSASMYANRGGPGAHVLAWARRAGFRAVQFNAVVETNAPAVALWQSLGFTIVGTVPEAFHHPRHGYVGLHVMHRSL